MPEIPIVTIDVEQFRTKKQNKLLQMLNDPNVKVNVNTRIKNAINQFVPKKTGALRASARVHQDYISWGEGLPQYARYQYYGEIYGPNLPGAENGNPAWRSHKGRKKYPMGRMMGEFNGVVLLHPRWQKGTPRVTGLLPYKFGYTTPNTGHHWDKYFRYAPKMKTNLEITRYLKKECKRRGLST